MLNKIRILTIQVRNFFKKGTHRRCMENEDSLQSLKGFPQLFAGTQESCRNVHKFLNMLSLCKKSTQI